MPVVGHDLTWEVRPGATPKQIAEGRHWRCRCECGMTVEGARWRVAPYLMTHLEKHEQLQFRGDR